MPPKRAKKTVGARAASVREPRGRAVRLTGPSPAPADVDDPRIPEICDMPCPFADFPPAETAGICRTMAAVWCRKLEALVNKNVPCTWRKVVLSNRRRGTR